VAFIGGFQPIDWSLLRLNNSGLGRALSADLERSLGLG